MLFRSKPFNDIYNTCNNDHKNLQLEKTNICDVYKIYGIIKKNNSYIKKYLGIAYIATYELSIKCKLLFQNINSLIMSCSFNNNKNKWVPIEVSKLQKIDILY